jgi:spermidine/putrescine transport system substrate-binding protein
MRLRLWPFVLIALAACSPKPAKLRILAWSDYLPDTVLREHEIESGFPIEVDIFNSNEELAERLQQSIEKGSEPRSGLRSEPWDLIMPSHYVVTDFAQRGWIKTLDEKRLGFLESFDPRFRNPTYDPGSKHSIAYVSGMTGLAINIKRRPELAARDVSWKEIFDNPKYKGEIFLLDDPLEVLSVGLALSGKSMANADEAAVREAFAVLGEKRAYIAYFMPNMSNLMRSGTCSLCQAYSGEAVAVATESPQLLRFAVPSSGGASLWTDTFAIPSNARNEDGAYAFLNRLMKPASAGEILNFNYQQLPHAASKLRVDARWLQDVRIFPDAATLGRLQDLRLKTELQTLAHELLDKLKAQR